MNPTSDSTDRRAVLERALRTIGEMQAKLDALERDKREPIAIVGMGCRFPGPAATPEVFWDLLQGGVDTIREVPRDRWDVDALYDPDPDSPGKIYTRKGAFLENVEQFDAGFFGMSARETLKTDPQQRLGVEVSWEALENAGIDPKSLSGTQTGVFLGITNSDYARLVERAGLQSLDAYHLTGNCLNFAAGRIAYHFGFRGPTMAIDSACSSSGVSVHVACQSLRNRECNLALAGGVNLILSPEISITSTKARTLSPDGLCKTFDASANGYVRGEGCGIVVLKRLSDALADGDRIHAVIRGSAVNQDGASSGITVPNKDAQVEVIRQALERAGIQPNQVDYVEAHGTGTPLGDPIEVRALASVYGNGRSADQPLIIGTVKTNIGHLESAAGIAGLIKVVLALQHRSIPPHLHFQKLNPAISLDEIPASIPLKLMPWPSRNRTRVAGVSSFGGSGTIVHTIVEEAPHGASATARNSRSTQLFCISGRNSVALHALAGEYASKLATIPTESLADVCYTADSGRSHFNHRLAVVTSSLQGLGDGLRAYQSGEDSAGLFHGECSASQKPKVVFLFTGQGGQYVNMAHGLYEGEPVFRKIIDRCDELLRPHLPTPLRSVLYPQPGESTPLNETQYTHVAMFAVQYGLAALWRSWGVEPSLIMGHSVGEIVAATVAGEMSFEDGLMLMYERGRLMQALPATGRMASLQADEERVQAAISPYRGQVSIAAVNGPESTVISGERVAVEAIVQELQSRVKTKILNVSNAFHSPLVEPVLPEFEAAARRIRYSAPEFPLFSSMRLKMVDQNNLLDATYWRHNLRNTVRFSDSIRKLYEQGYRTFLEIGPSPILVNMGSQCVPPGEGTWLPSIREGKEDWQQLLETTGELYVNGLDIDWRHFYQDRRAGKMTLPTYPFQRERYWIDSPDLPHLRASTGKTIGHPLLGTRLSSPWPVFEQELNSTTVSFLNQHCVFDKPVLPASAYLEMAVAAAEQVVGSRQCVVRNLVLARPLIVTGNDRRTVQTVITQAQSDAMTFQVFGLYQKDGTSDGDWLLHATGELAISSEEKESDRLDLAKVRGRCNQEVSTEKFYESAHSRGLEFGPVFRAVRELWKTDGEVIASIDAAPSLTDAPELYRIHPAMLDAFLQPVALLLPPAQTYLPQRLESFRLFRSPMGRAWSHVALRPGSGDDSEVAVDIDVVDGEAQKICEIRGLVLRQASRKALTPLDQEDLSEWLYELNWEESSQVSASKVQSSGFLAHPARVADDLHSYLGPDENLKQFAALLPRLEALSTLYVSRALIELGWSLTQQQQFTTESLGRQLRVLPRHHRLLARMLEMLAEDGRLAREDDKWKVLQALPDGDPETELSVLLAKYSFCSAELTLVGRCGRNLAQAMRGEVEPLELLFPNGSLSDVEALYKDSPYFRFYNKLMGNAVFALVSGLPSDRRLRILEVGAGTGSVTSCVLPKLPGRTEYVFTDVSTLFGSRARQTFAAYPFVTYQVLDIEKEPLEQGFSQHSFDVVIAANSLHATADLRQTLEHVRTLLRPDGSLLLLEATGKLRFADLIVGLTEGWWRFSDTELRPSHALLSREKWSNLLAATGFRDVAMAPPLDGQGVLSNQCLILARASHASRLAGPAARTDSRKWLLVGEADNVAIQLKALLNSQTESCALVAAAADRSGFAERLRQAGSTEESPLDEVIYFVPAADTTDSSKAWPGLRDAIRGGCEPLLHLVQALVSRGKARTKNLRIVTRGAFPIDSDATSRTLHQYPVAALASTIALEYPELNCTHIDLDPLGADGEVEQLLEAFSSGKRTEERRVAFRRGRRFVARLTHSDAALSEAPKTTGKEAARPRNLTISSPGILENLRLSDLQRREPGAGEVEIEVRASGIGFRDVLIALGQYPGNSATLGYECVGKVVKVGPGANSFAVGQRVIAVGAGGFASFLTIPVDRIVAVPVNLTDEDAATIPSAFLTAQYALVRLGKILAGERVLIHAAAGGVGLAAIQVARRANAEIFATAGTPEKRAYLKSLGVSHIMDSRSLDFGREIMDITHGQGVNLVLNCLAGEFIRQSLSVTAVKGRFLEIGKTGIWDHAQVARFRDVSYFPIDLASEFEKSPDLASSLFKEILCGFVDGTLQPLPKKIFAIGDAATAFRYMAQGRHTGKIVLSHPGGEHSSDSLSDGSTEIVLKPDATYLVTGGLSGLGLLTAEWLVERGAKNLVLMGRREPSSAALELIGGMQESGARVSIVRGDVSDRESVAQLFASFGHSQPPLRGIIHAAGTLDDGVLNQQSWERFEKVMAPKVDGAWYLHTLSQDQPLDFFVLFSSAVSMLGSAGQANHVAACAFEDALAHYRRAQGLPALSINWGPWAETGAAMQGTLSERLQMKGFRLIDSERGLRLLERLMLRNRTQVGAMSADWRLYGESFPPGHGTSLLSRVFRADALPAGKTQTTAQPALQERLRQAPPQKRRQVLEEYVRGQAVKVLGVGPSFKLDPHQGLATFGMDSLMTIEFKNRLQVGVGKTLSSTIVFDHPTVAALAEYLDQHVLQETENSKAAAADEQAQQQTSGLMEVAEMSEEEAEAILAKELSSPA